MLLPQAGVEAFGALCLEPYSRGRILAGYSSIPSQESEVEAPAAGGIATIDLAARRCCQRCVVHGRCMRCSCLPVSLVSSTPT